MRRRQRGMRDVVITYYDSDDEEYVVTAQVYPGYPGDFTGPIETACPPEGPEVEIQEVTHKGQSIPVDEFLKMESVDEERVFEQLLLEGDDDE